MVLTMVNGMACVHCQGHEQLGMRGDIAAIKPYS